MNEKLMIGEIAKVIDEEDCPNQFEIKLTMSNQKNHNVTHSEEELMDALEKLEETLEEQERQSAASTPDDRTLAKSPQKPKPKPQGKSKQDVFLSALEEAVADIDQFMADKHSPSDET